MLYILKSARILRILTDAEDVVENMGVSKPLHKCQLCSPLLVNEVKMCVMKRIPDGDVPDGILSPGVFIGELVL